MKNINFSHKSIYTVFSTFVIISFLFYPYNPSLAAVMGSSTYKIQSDSVNVGGQDSASATYNLGDTTGEAGTGESASATYKMKAGYQQMQEDAYLSISSPSDLALTSIGGLSNQVSEGTISWLVTTDNVAGYSLTIASTTTPALKSAFDSFADYTPAGADPDYNYNNLATNSSFGFSAEGTEAISRFKDNGVACNTGTLETVDKCWDGLSTTPKAMAGSATANHPSGSTVTARVRAENGASHLQSAGNYAVTLVVTAVTL
ncbi:hypothetical protein HXX01_03125 [Candidatus Nomurabacteria bacterium]|nr:hypothetical protein [Candidatus Nomurabacteria bacterium]